VWAAAAIVTLMLIDVWLSIDADTACAVLFMVFLLNTCKCRSNKTWTWSMPA
jgi:hypothetical protein